MAYNDLEKMCWYLLQKIIGSKGSIRHLHMLSICEATEIT